MIVNLIKKKAIHLVIICVVLLVVAIGIFIIEGRDGNSVIKLDTYDPCNSYIISAEQISSKVANESDARELLANHDLGKEYILKDTFELEQRVVYHFQESYEGLPIHGRYSNVITCVDSTVEGIASNYFPINLDITPMIDTEDVLDICNQYWTNANLAIENVFIELCIYGYDADIKLSYCVYVGNNSIYIDAVTGEIIQVFDNMNTVDCLLNSNLGEVLVTVQEKDRSYECMDNTRGGGIESCVLPIEAEGIFDFKTKNRTRVIISPDTVEDYRSSIDAYYNVERAYDYYSKVHQFQSTDGNNNRKLHIINNMDGYKNFNDEDEIVSFINNAATTTLYNSDGTAETWFLISRINENAEELYSYYLDAISHEYTHAVMFSVVGNSVRSEMNAMGEAYSDIMGECCEAYYNIKGDWNFEGTRNISNIANGINKGKNINSIDEYTDKLDAHDASTVVSSAAYYMHTGVNENGEKDSTYAIHSYETLSKLWFGSMFYLTPSSDFLTCRYAVEEVADFMFREGMINEKQVQGIQYAFEKVGIRGNAVEEHDDLLKTGPSFKLQINDKTGMDYTECDMTICRIYGGNNYQGHNIGIKYRGEEPVLVYNGSFADYPQKKIKYEQGSIYSINLKDNNSFIEELFVFEVINKGPKKLVLQASFLGSDFVPVKTEQSSESSYQSDEIQGRFVLDNPYPGDYKINETAYDNLFSGHFANLSAPMGLEEGCKYDSSKLFAVKGSYDMEDPVNGSYYLFIADVLGNVYDMLPISKYPKVATGWLKDDVFYCEDGSNVNIMKQGEDITSNFFGDNLRLLDVINDSNGIMFFTEQTVLDSPYHNEDSLSDVRYDLWNDSGEIILSYYRNELVNKYGIESWIGLQAYDLINLGNGVYHISNRKNNENNRAQYVFVDIKRGKAFALPDNNDAQYEDIESDGNYILISHERTDSVSIFDIETEEFIILENISEAYSLGESKFFTDIGCYDVKGNIIFSNEEIDINDKISKVGAYHNGQALVIIDRGSYYQSREHVYEIGIINENGNIVNVFEELDSRAIYRSYVHDLGVYCIFSHEGSGGFLKENNIFQQEMVYKASEKDCYYGIEENGNTTILRYGQVDTDYSNEISTEALYGYELFVMD